MPGVMKYAIIKNGGHQYKVEVGQVIEVEKVKTDGAFYVFEDVLLVVDGDNVEIGAPTIAGMKVYADVVAEIKGEKIEVFKYKSKSRYRKHTGHRQKYTRLKISGIGVKIAAEPKKVSSKKALKPEVASKSASTVSKRSTKSVAKKKAAK